MQKGYCVSDESFKNWALENKWLCVASDIYITPNGVLVSVFIVDGCIVDITVSNDSREV